jgi:WXXGXW repeat (2 copies)
MHKVAIRSLLLVFAMLAVSVPAFSQVAVGVSVGFGPPAIPVYDQPVCPGDGYIWTPGYWAWDADFDDYYWIPGTWVEPPDVGLLWTPGYWAWNGDAFMFNDGYWGPEVGFYGGIDYGFGYFGGGFVGGRWDGGHFFYNRAVSHVDVTVIHNVYEERVTNVTENRVSYNGGNGGVNARPTPQQESAAHQRHVAPVAAQMQQVQAARSNRDLRASANHGKPPIAATNRPGAFNDHVEKAKDAGAPYNPPANRSAVNARPENNAANNSNAAERERSNNQPNNVSPGRPANNGSNNAVIHPKDIPAYERPPAPNTGNAKTDQKYQQQQQKLADQQDKQRQKLEQQQDNEHQQYQKQQADEQKNQALEQKHQQQTQQLQQRQAQQQQAMQKRQAPRPAAHAAPEEHSTPTEPKEK